VPPHQGGEGVFVAHRGEAFEQVAVGQVTAGRPASQAVKVAKNDPQLAVRHGDPAGTNVTPHSNGQAPGFPANFFPSRWGG
jgi:hypothetical protein